MSKSNIAVSFCAIDADKESILIQQEHCWPPTTELSRFGQHAP